MTFSREQIIERIEQTRLDPTQRALDLSGLDLRGVDLSSLDLRGADLSRADLTNADLRWTIEWRDGQPWRFNTTYNLVRSADGWRVLLCTAYTEARLHRESGNASAT